MNPNYSTIKTSEKGSEKVVPAKESREKGHREIVKELSVALANTYTVYLKTQNYHWNVTGPLFGTLHRIFDEHYHELADAIDKIAERIRAIGSYAPATYRQFQEFTNIDEDRDTPAADMMLQNLVRDHESIVVTLRQSIRVADEVNDAATSDLLVKRINEHEKYAWMLKSFTKGTTAENGRTTQH